MKPVYSHVAVIGIDGMGNFNRQTPTPRMDEFFKDGAVTYDALSMNPTISAENWGAMLLGANPIAHGLTNSIVSHYEYVNSELPSVFKRIREWYPDAYLAACSTWDPINRGIIERDVGADLRTADNDTELMLEITDVVAQKPMFLFVQFDDVDGAGHHSNYGSTEHLNKISETDTLVGRIFDAYKEAGILDDTLIIVTADHGGIRNGHGGYMDTEKYVFMGAKGKSVPCGSIGTACTKDVAAIIMYAFGIDIPTYDRNGFSSQVPVGIFTDAGDNYYVPLAKQSYIQPKKTPDFYAENGITAFLPKEKIKLAMFLDNSLNDASGQHRGKEHGLVKYYSDGVRGAYAEFGKTGHVTFDDVSVGDNSFSIALWIKIDRSISEAPAVCGNKDWWWQNRRGRGFVLALRCADVWFNIGTGDDCFDLMTTFPDDISDGWIHTIVTFDKEKKELRTYYNFKLVHCAKLEDKCISNFDSMPFTVGDDGLGIYNCETHDFLIHIDDLLFLDGTLSDAELESFTKYYE